MSVDNGKILHFSPKKKKNMIFLFIYFFPCTRGGHSLVSSSTAGGELAGFGWSGGEVGGWISGWGRGCAALSSD